jgi:hypothetical protein
MIFSMKGLKHERIDINVKAPYMHREHEKIIYAPLLDLPVGVEVEVCVCWKKDISVPVDETWPFILTRGMVCYTEGEGEFRLGIV